MNDWYDKSNAIECSLEMIISSYDDIGALYVDVVSLMPGLTSVELIGEDSNSVTIKTNEGIMTRKNISIRTENVKLSVEYDEDYKAGRINVKSHVLNEFVASGAGVKHRLVINKVRASGVMGFLYKNFAKNSIGNSLLGTYKEFFEK